MATATIDGIVVAVAAYVESGTRWWRRCLRSLAKEEERTFPPFFFEPEDSGDFSPFHFRRSLCSDLGDQGSLSALDLCSRSQLSISAFALSSISPSQRRSSRSLEARQQHSFSPRSSSLASALPLSLKSLSRYCQLFARRLSRFQGALPISSSFSALAAALPLSLISLALLLIANPFHGKEKCCSST
ncbi:hypothetical protein MRB53_003825 [Persea americana]|uniref:Uncharacterized protein n=1 Tax=Persea americana TaxID=3435 RepID=A0ACC2MYB5_PERAE|nr:hypothetical protein MRB53_003825 [Persea americana]